MERYKKSDIINENGKLKNGDHDGDHAANRLNFVENIMAKMI